MEYGLVNPRSISEKDNNWQINDWYCLEVNPNPGYHWFEKNSQAYNYPISKDLLNFLQSQGKKKSNNTKN